MRKCDFCGKKSYAELVFRKDGKETVITDICEECETLLSNFIISTVNKRMKDIYGKTAIQI